MTQAEKALSRPSRRHGFTFIEAVVVLSIMAILVATATPRLLSWRRSSEVMHVAEAIKAGIHRARVEAIRRNGNVSIYFMSTNASGLLDNTCHASLTSPAWVIAVTPGAGQGDENPVRSACGSDVNEFRAPFIIAKWAPHESGKRVVVENTTRDCVTANTDVHTTFDGYGRVGPNSSPPACYVVRHKDAREGDLVLNVRLSGSNVRICRPDANLDANDPRRCPDFAMGD